MSFVNKCILVQTIGKMIVVTVAICGGIRPIWGKIFVFVASLINFEFLIGQNE
jgi:hypothetical protein